MLCCPPRSLLLRDAASRERERCLGVNSRGREWGQKEVEGGGIGFLHNRSAPPPPFPARETLISRSGVPSTRAIVRLDVERQGWAARYKGRAEGNAQRVRPASALTCSPAQVRIEECQVEGAEGPTPDLRAPHGQGRSADAANTFALGRARARHSDGCAVMCRHVGLGTLPTRALSAPTSTGGTWRVHCMSCRCSCMCKRFGVSLRLGSARSLSA